ncbi:hypothetical protein QF000_007553 [Paraburkholderia atlantica]
MERASCRPPTNASATSAAIHSARCAGTLKPASAACSAAKIAPAVTPTSCAGKRSGQLRPSQPDRRQIAAASQPVSPATKPICKPEIATR